MRIAIAGPFETNSLRRSLGLRLDGAPPGVRETPLNPLTAGLVVRGHDVHVVALDPEVEQPFRLSEGNLTLHFLPQRQRVRDRALSLFSRETAALTETLLAIDSDIVHAHWTYEFAEAALRAGAPYLVTMHDSPFAIVWHARDAYRVSRLLMALRTMPRIRRLAVVSPYLVRAARWHGYPRRILVVPNGVEVPADPPLLPERRLGPGRSHRIVTVGDPWRRKNVRRSLEAFAIIRERFPHAELHLFGPGLDRAYAKGAAGVHAHGNVEHETLMRFLADDATLLIHPSLEESWGVIVAEAMMRGIPCIAGSRSGGVPYVLGPELAGQLVDVRSPHAIATKAIGLLADVREYSRVSERSSQRARTALSDDLMVERYLEVYAEILGQSD